MIIIILLLFYNIKTLNQYFDLIEETRFNNDINKKNYNNKNEYNKIIYSKNKINNNELKNATEKVDDKLNHVNDIINKQQKEIDIDNKKNEIIIEDDVIDILDKENDRILNGDINEKINEQKENGNKKKTDLDYIKEYRGGELEPEWEWVKNISIVYTWVDGSDVDFLDIKSKYNGGFRQFNSRDRSADELRYSIRSLEKYMPWFNGTIYIATFNQIPKWLDTSNPRIKMVFHKDFIPEHYYPTFDSNTIEMFLDKIPGITERFLYFNDDIFLNNYIHPCFFFTSEGFYPKIYRRNVVPLTIEKTNQIINKDSVAEMFHTSKYFTRAVLRDYFDNKFQYRYLLHSVFVLYRDMFEPFRQTFKEEFKVVFANRFRCYYEPHGVYIHQTLLSYVIRESENTYKFGGNGKASKLPSFTLPDNRTVKDYSSVFIPAKVSKEMVRFGSITNNAAKNNDKFNSFRKDKNLLVYNFNDEYSKSSSLHQFSKYMITRYPKPSSFEKKDYKELEKDILTIIHEFEGFTKKLTEDMPKKYGNSTLLELDKEVENFELGIVSQYLEKKETLSEPQDLISKREKEEIKFLLNYKGEELEKEWQWASTVSIVYILENQSSNNNILAQIEEIKYSIRSVENFLPWFKGKIYIITQSDELKDQLTWINKENQRIEIINQNDIIPESAKNTKNIHVLEMYLDKIPNLSERFIYLKGNHYFVNYVHPRFFFSKEFYPKYNLKSALNKKEISNLIKNDPQFYQTFSVLMDYFSKNYLKHYRYFDNAPYTFYRDLFSPVRQLFGIQINKMIKGNNNPNQNILPLYLVTNYNIYATEQPLYPEYVTGYGKIRNAKLPILNEKRTINYFGFDVTTPAIAKDTTIYDIPIANITNVKRFTKDLNDSKKIFFSLKINNHEEILNKNYYKNLMTTLFSKPSTFEN
ncbi:hypothetical protein BCR32DRAFT_327418 [Anaeromyces robustus]|uniref:Stealth protein CR2 conserved region 2 domain-containing protein n=1 Tax=Anaeromyces robustus TaxID=1754192 RepID=A0A1Y1X620_9FUNG|nr:hypothetical protein BCR32DRAFT_327418 [Anaeromyces robustus]|eukprot:ORX81118.1 hypothetical protein BCR32DRAFT_327418 [Anaeromyces robustus]